MSISITQSATPAPFPARRDRVQRGPARPVAVGVRVEHRLHHRLQIQPGYRLGDPVRHRRYSEHHGPLCLLPWRSPPPSPAAGSTQPDDIRFQILYKFRSQVFLELADRLLVDPRRALVGLDPLNTPPRPSTSRSETACPATSARSPGSSRPPRLTAKQAWATRPLRSARITGPSSLLRDGPPPCPAPVLGPSRFLLLGGLPLGWPAQHPASTIGATGSHVPC